MANEVVFFRSIACSVPSPAVPWLRPLHSIQKASVGTPPIASVSDDTETSLPTLLSVGGVEIRETPRWALYPDGDWYFYKRGGAVTPAWFHNRPLYPAHVDASD